MSSWTPPTDAELKEREAAHREFDALRKAANVSVLFKAEIMLNRLEAAEAHIASLSQWRDTKTRSSNRVREEIQSMVAEYRAQVRDGQVDTPGGLEHMGDVWKLLCRWAEDLKETP